MLCLAGRRWWDVPWSEQKLARQRMTARAAADSHGNQGSGNLLATHGQSAVNAVMQRGWPFPPDTHAFMRETNTAARRARETIHAAGTSTHDHATWRDSALHRKVDLDIHPAISRLKPVIFIYVCPVRMASSAQVFCIHLEPAVNRESGENSITCSLCMTCSTSLE